ncbi:MAG: recombinase [Bacteroidetes bacterium 24-39-8]|jgi:integrase|nr:MAG: recombinase [Sphingobacteriia bacterium 35-40-8]OYZ52533.1 MAG: recombinase [Bacteroidetes bacterium 24-39-8]HQR92212.1 site-specific integrase [Sediminibacterium sp.]HQS54054.1 site-specific integrase [Sediminibacterium sp.]
MNVKLRQRLKGDKISLYLDIYTSGKREYEYLNLYLVPEPEKGKLTKEQRDENRKTFVLADGIRSKRFLEMMNGTYGFRDREKAKGSFLRFVEYLIQKRNTSKGNYDNWDSMFKHLKKYVKTDVTFNQINKQWLEGFKDYLHVAKTPADKLLSQNSQLAYYSKLCAALKQAYRDGIIQKNPAEVVAGLKAGETERSFLTYDELQAMFKADCDFPILKQAFIFSALSGLRWSDVEKLTWVEVQHSKEMGYYIRFRQKKTKDTETLPISDQAYQLLGERRNLEDQVFEGLKYSAWHNLKLQQWAMRAGITKHITFHSARHSFATLQLTLGTDIYTVSKMLGHKNLKTTQVYAKVIDQKKQEAANKIKLEL